jgi:hypothetical protein
MSVGRGAVGDEGTNGAHEVAPAGIFHLDDLSPHVTEEARAERRADPRPDVYHA